MSDDSRINAQDFYWEYINLVDNVIHSFLNTVEKLEPLAFVVGSTRIQKAIINLLSVVLMRNERRAVYNERRKFGVLAEIMEAEISSQLLADYCQDYSVIPTTGLMNVSEDENYNALSLYKNCKLYYCINRRQFEYLKPILKNESEQIILLVTFPFNIEAPSDNVVVIEWTFFLERKYIENRFLQKNFPTIFEDTNCITLFISALSPKLVVILEGCHDDMAVLSAVCKSFDIKTVCIQQGWPTLMNSRFRNMDFDYFLTWGLSFSNLFKQYSKIPQFVHVGYPYQVAKDNNRNGIVFFLQCPALIVDGVYFGQLLELIEYVATNFPLRMIFIKEHPECRLDFEMHLSLKKYSNISFFDRTPLYVVFSQAMITVSIFSSTLIESLVHGAIPFIFNPSSAPIYFPDLELLGLGVAANSLSSAKSKLSNLIRDEELSSGILRNIVSGRKDYFYETGEAAVSMLTHTLNDLSRRGSFD